MIEIQTGDRVVHRISHYEATVLDGPEEVDGRTVVLVRWIATRRDEIVEVAEFVRSKHQPSPLAEVPACRRVNRTTQRGRATIRIDSGDWWGALLSVAFPQWIPNRIATFHTTGALTMVTAEVPGAFWRRQGDGHSRVVLGMTVMVPVDRVDEAVRVAQSYLADHGFEVRRDVAMTKSTASV